MSKKQFCEEDFGGYPRCGKLRNMLNVGRNHWGVCDRHETSWWIGSNLFSDWRYETMADWEANAKQLACYANVEPMADGEEIPEPDLVQ